MADKNISEEELRKSIKQEIVDGVSYYYGIGKKDQKSFSLMSNQRLLILDSDNCKLFYNNQTRGLPFRNSIPQPKNTVLDVPNITAMQEVGTSKLQISFPFEKSYNSWKFQFQTQEVATEWYRLIDMHKVPRVKEVKPVNNKSVAELAKIEQENTHDIVKDEHRDIPIDQSRLVSQLVGLSKSKVEIQPQPLAPSRVQQQQQQDVRSNDWNYRFYKNRHIKVLYQFQGHAGDTFFSLLKNDDMRRGGVRQYETQSCIVRMANKFTFQAKMLKNQYRNYHFILEATSKQWIIGVPLACLVQFQTVVGLVKAKFPHNLQVIHYENITKESFNDLQRYTRVKNRCLQAAVFYNLAQYYQPNSQALIYVDELKYYLPPNLQFPEETLIRPEFMLDNVNYYVYTNHPQKLSKNDIRQLKELSYSTLEKIKTFSLQFYKQEFPVTKISELKDILHEAGLNMKYLGHIHGQCGSQQIKNYLYTAMAVKIVKDYVFESLVALRKNENRPFQSVLEETLGWVLSGSNNKSHELWKEIALLFKKKYNTTLNLKELLPGFFLNSILQIIPAKYDLSKLNRNRTIFQHSKIFQPGFVTLLQPKVKCMNRFLPPYLQQLKSKAKYNNYSKQMCEQIKNIFFNRDQVNAANYFTFANNDEWIITYLSLYYPPQNMADQGQEKIKGLFSRVNQQPPSNFTMNLTKNYLDWCVKKQNIDEFKRVFKIAMEIADYWLEEIHPVRSDLLKSLSDYYFLLNLNPDMIKFMKDSLMLSSKFWGGNAQQTGLRQYEMADRYLRANRKRQAAELFNKAKDNMLKNKTKTNKLGLTYIKLASIQLSELQYNRTIQLAKESLLAFQDYQHSVKSIGLYNQPYKIKAYQLLARVYEICDQRSQYRDLALTIARKFNTTQSSQVYQQMLRICMAAVIFKSTVERAESFQVLVQNLNNLNIDSGPPQRLPPIDELRRMGQDSVVMQKFMSKYQFIDRSFFDSNARKKQFLLSQNKQFIHIVKNMVEVIGLDYVRGVIEQKVSCG